MIGPTCDFAVQRWSLDEQLTEDAYRTWLQLMPARDHWLARVVHLSPRLSGKDDRSGSWRSRHQL